jgi:ribonuclease III
MDLGEFQVETAQDFAKRLNLKFQNSLLLQRALTHRSYLNEHHEAIEDNERLEFLGDAVLDFLVGAWLYNRFPEMQEGDLTRLRSALVRTEQLAEFAASFGFGSALRLGRGESQAGGRDRKALLCATFEAIVGALYLDAGLDSVRSFIEPLLEPASTRILAANRDHDAKSMLQEMVQSQGYPAPIYHTVDSYGPEHSKVFQVEVIVNGSVIARGDGTSKQSAAQQAAQAAILIIENGKAY